MNTDRNPDCEYGLRWNLCYFVRPRSGFSLERPSLVCPHSIDQTNKPSNIHPRIRSFCPNIPSSVSQPLTCPPNETLVGRQVQAGRRTEAKRRRNGFDSSPCVVRAIRTRSAIPPSESSLEWNVRGRRCTTAAAKNTRPSSPKDT